MSMSAATSRAFVIYTDDSTSTTGNTTEQSLSPSNSSRIVVATATDKENVDPLTGQTPSIEEQLLAKKRKTNVLVAKIVVTTKAPQPDQKKRKVLSASSSNSRSRTEKKERKALGSKKSRNGSSSRVRAVDELPKVEEEEVFDAPVSKSNVQAQADSRCYELTVMPLADVSQAYTPSTIEEEIAVASEKLKAARISKDSAVDPSEARPSSPDTSIPEEVTATPRSSSEIIDLSTPERKRIYSAFTFSSPSPASERYVITKSASGERFSDVAFNLERTM
ncbi:hypothetical protein BXZ70DRAFT_111034 [Cristinia sonorae]|uniref:Uncharacterized protein n=1 Tax=Cristinia sonorae TaxID=1940300 RepID=A0A8K0UQP6_9AGAR|nr:hypothetical protein BXZ70DRAFT_111034 [Cristinia sonorae]